MALEARTPEFLEPDEPYCVYSNRVRVFEEVEATVRVQGRYNQGYVTWTAQVSKEPQRLTLWVGPAPVDDVQGARQVEHYIRVTPGSRASFCFEDHRTYDAL